MNINDILNSGQSPANIISKLKEKSIFVPSWGGAKGLFKEYDPKQHPVMSPAIYPDKVLSDGTIERVTRIPLNFQKLATKRMTELMTGVPVVREYKAETDKQREAARVMESIFNRARIDAVNIDRLRKFFASCEVMTLWYSVDSPNTYYGTKSAIKVRCRTLSPMSGDRLYPLFDEYDDLVALSVEYMRKINGVSYTFFDCYTSDRHIKWSNSKAGFEVIEDEKIELGKIPAIYMHRTEPIWEETSSIIYDMEWQMSRNGNYLRKNSKPRFAVFADEEIKYGDEDDQVNRDLSVLQFPTGSSAQYITWAQATENLTYHVSTLRNLIFTQLQLPDWSYEKMSQQALSGESRKQLLVDAQAKVKDESGVVLEFLDREVNVVKQFAKAILGSGYESEIDELQVENIITPFSMTDEKDTIANLMSANGGKPIATQRETIAALGWSSDPDATMEQIRQESTNDVFNAYE